MKALIDNMQKDISTVESLSPQEINEYGENLLVLNLTSTYFINGLFCFIPTQEIISEEFVDRLFCRFLKYYKDESLQNNELVAILDWIRGK